MVRVISKHNNVEVKTECLVLLPTRNKVDSKVLEHFPHQSMNRFYHVYEAIPTDAELMNGMANVDWKEITDPFVVLFLNQSSDRAPIRYWCTMQTEDTRTNVLRIMKKYEGQ